MCLTGLGVFYTPWGTELDALEFFPGLTSAQGVMSCLPVRSCLLLEVLAWCVGNFLCPGGLAEPEDLSW